MRFFVGPCVIESEIHAIGIGLKLADMAARLGVEVTFKASFDKANRSSARSPRGPGLGRGLDILQRVRQETGLRILTDVHETEQVSAAASAVDVLQIPAFLCRQTDLLQAAVTSGRPVLVKKGQFMSPAEMANVVDKARAAVPHGELPRERLMLCERGTTFGYNDLVVDMRGLVQMREFGHPVVFDATHAVQRPGAAGLSSGGDREMVPALARAAAAVGVDAIFIETHPDPARALSDSATVWPLDRLEPLLAELIAIDRLIHNRSTGDAPSIRRSADRAVAG